VESKVGFIFHERESFWKTNESVYEVHRPHFARKVRNICKIHRFADELDKEGQTWPCDGTAWCGLSSVVLLSETSFTCIIYSLIERCTCINLHSFMTCVRDSPLSFSSPKLFLCTAIASAHRRCPYQCFAFAPGCLYPCLRNITTQIRSIFRLIKKRSLPNRKTGKQHASNISSELCKNRPESS